MAITVYRPRRFVAQWMRFHKLNVITIKELFYLHKQARKRDLRLPRELIDREPDHGQYAPSVSSTPRDGAAS